MKNINKINKQKNLQLLLNWILRLISIIIWIIAIYLWIQEMKK